MKKKLAVLMATVMMATMPGLTVLADELSDEILVEELTEDVGLSDNSTSNDDLIIEAEDLADEMEEASEADISDNSIGAETERNVDAGLEQGAETEISADIGTEQDSAKEGSETDDADVSFVDDAGVSLVIEEIVDTTGQDVDAFVEAASDDASVDIIASGTCEDNLTWVLDGEGTLTISGTGEMSYTGGWTSYKDDIRMLVIEEGVTSIYVSTFSGCMNLTDVTIPESLTSIRTYAFQNCTSLTSITVPSSLIELGSGAFQGCTSLTDINITLSYDTVGIGSHILDDTAYYNDSANWENGLFYYGDYLMGADADQLDQTCEIRTGTTIIIADVFSDCTDLSSITIPEGMKVIWNSAFENCTSLTTIDLPDSLIRLGAYVFQGCEALTEINTGSNINGIGSDAFVDTGFYNDETNWEGGVLYLGNYLLAADSDTLEGSYQVKEGTTLLSARAFYGCSLLTEISIPDRFIRNY